MIESISYMIRFFLLVVDINKGQNHKFLLEDVKLFVAVKSI